MFTKDNWKLGLLIGFLSLPGLFVYYLMRFRDVQRKGFFDVLMMQKSLVVGHHQSCTDRKCNCVHDYTSTNTKIKLQRGSLLPPVSMRLVALGFKWLT
jgi:hypothetical protein